MKEKELDKKIKDAVKDNDSLDFYDTFEEPLPVDSFTRKKKISVKKVSFLATAAVLLIVAVSGIAVYNNSDDDKQVDIIDKNLQVGQEKGDVILAIKSIEDTDAVNEALNIFPDLKIEEILFDDYKFSNAVIRKNKSEITVNTVYQNSEGDEIIVQQKGKTTLIKNNS